MMAGEAARRRNEPEAFLLIDARRSAGGYPACLLTGKMGPSKEVVCG